MKRHKTIPIIHSLESNEGQDALANLICDQLDNEVRMVLETEYLSGEQRMGKWGVDEPSPLPPPPPNG